MLETLVDAGKKMKKAAGQHQKIKSAMSKIIRENGSVSSEETLEKLIQYGIICEADMMSAIEVLKGSKEEQEEVIKSILAGYTI